MNKNLLVRLTKLILDFMFFTGIIICSTVPFSFKYASQYYTIFKSYYMAYCVIFMLAGLFALTIIWELRKMFGTVIKGDPFVVGNVISLKRMGICAFVISISMAARLIFVITPSAMVLVVVFLIAGLFSMVLSLVFEQAVTFKLENDLTIWYVGSHNGGNNDRSKFGCSYGPEKDWVDGVGRAGGHYDGQFVHS